MVVDFEASGLRGGFNDAPVPPFNPGGISHARVEGQGSLRGKLGAAYGRFLVYATGGLATGHLKYDYLNPSNGLSETTTAWHSGWTAGLGIEYAFTGHLSGFAEYRATRYGKFKFASRVAYAGFLTGEQQPRFNSAMVGVSYKY